MLRALSHFAVVAGTMLVLAQNLPGFHVTGWTAALIAAVVLAFANAVLKPVLFLLTLPLTLVTLGGFLLVLNIGMLWITQAVVPGFDIVGLKSLVIGSVVLSIVSLVWKAIVPDDKHRRRDRKEPKDKR